MISCRITALKKNPYLSKERNIAVILLSNLSVKFSFYQVNIYAFRLCNIIVSAIPSSAIYTQSLKHHLPPPVEYRHVKAREIRRKQLSGQEIIVESIAIRGKRIRYINIAVLKHFYTISSAASVL